MLTTRWMALCGSDPPTCTDTPAQLGLFPEALAAFQTTLAIHPGLKNIARLVEDVRKQMAAQQQQQQQQQQQEQQQQQPPMKGDGGDSGGTSLPGGL
jgi:hypothetical protein